MTEFKIKDDKMEDVTEFYLEKKGSDIVLVAKKGWMTKNIISISQDGRLERIGCASIDGIQTDRDGRIVGE